MVCFTIRTYVEPLNHLWQSPKQKKDALKTLKSLPQETMVYKGMESFHPALMEALEK